jgi:hypothetical protein
MKKRLIQALTRLASTQYQDIYVVGGSSDEYVVPEHILEDVTSLCALSNREDYRIDFDENQRARLNSLLSEIGRHGEQIFASQFPVSAQELIHENPSWNAIRNEAQNCLRAFGIDIASVDPYQIDTLK